MEQKGLKKITKKTRNLATAKGRADGRPVTINVPKSSAIRRTQNDHDQRYHCPRWYSNSIDVNQRGGPQTMGPSCPMVISSSSFPTWIRQHVHNYCPVATHARVSIHSVHGLGSHPLSLHLTDGPLNAWLSHGSSEIPYCVVSPATVRGQVPRSELSLFAA